MVRDEEKYQLATQFRKRGFSYSEIAKICGVSKSTVSLWLSKKAFSKQVRKHNTEKAVRDNVKRIALLNKAKSNERARRYREAVKAAETEYKHYKATPLFTAGIILYLASGDRTDSSLIRLSSKQPEEHKIFIKFMTEYLGVEKTQIKCWLLLPEGVSEVKTLSEWSKQIRLPKSRFGKSQFLSQNKKAPLHNGTGNTIIGNTVLKRKLNRWVELATKEL